MPCGLRRVVSALERRPLPAITQLHLLPTCVRPIFRRPFLRLTSVELGDGPGMEGRMLAWQQREHQGQSLTGGRQTVLLQP